MFARSAEYRIAGIALPSPPIVSATSVLFDDAALLFGANDELLARQCDRLDTSFQYGAISTPTVDAVATAVAQLEGAAAALLTPSGQSAAMLIVSALARSGGSLIVADSLTYSTLTLFEDLAKRLQFRLCRFGIDELDNATAEELAAEAPFAFFLELPGGFGFEIPDIDKILGIAKQIGVPSVVDNTWSSSVFFRPLKRGADFVVLSLSKLYGGPAGASLGAIAATNRTDVLKLRSLAALFGLNVSPEATARLSLCMSTLRVRVQAQDAATRTVMAHLNAFGGSLRLLHPALQQHPNHQRWAQYFSGACPVFTIAFDHATPEVVSGAMRQSKLFRAALGWGSCVSSYYLFNPGGWRLRNSNTFHGRAFVRIYVGLEDAADLVHDLEGAFANLLRHRET